MSVVSCTYTQEVIVLKMDKLPSTYLYWAWGLDKFSADSVALWSEGGVIFTGTTKQWAKVAASSCPSQVTLYGVDDASTFCTTMNRWKLPLGTNLTAPFHLLVSDQSISPRKNSCGNEHLSVRSTCLGCWRLIHILSTSYPCVLGSTPPGQSFVHTQEPLK